MSRRSSGGSGIEPVFVAIAVVAVAVIFIVPYALAILLYTFPLLILWLLATEEIEAEPQLVIDASPHQHLATLRSRMRHANEQYTYVRYNDWGIRWSDNLDRFDERSPRGRDLNNELEKWTSEYHHIRDEIDEVEAPERKAFEAWSNAVYSWHRQHARKAAKETGWKLALQVFVGVWIAAELVGLAYPDFINVFAFAWNPAPDFLHPGLALGATAAWVTGVYRVYNPPKHFAERAEAQINEYQSAKRSREEDEDRRTTSSSGEERFQGEREDRDEPVKQDFAWYEILNVDPQSPIADIKAAYKKMAMTCHPDKVAHMSEHIQEVAKEEMQKLNDAFQQAQIARGF
jgi:DnaJ domain